MLRSLLLASVAALIVATGCGASGDEYEPDDSLDEYSTIDVGTSQTRTFHDEQDIDVVRFTAVESTSYVIFTEMDDEEMDTVLSLYDSNGDEVAYNDDYEAVDYYTYASRIYWTAPESGDYFVEASVYEDTPTGTYYLTVQINDLLDAYEIDDSMEDAKDIEVGTVQERSFHDVSDVDYVRFEATALSAFEISLSVPEGEVTDPILSILMEDGRQFGFNDNASSSGTDAALYWIAPEDGIYYVVASCRVSGNYVLGMQDITEDLEQLIQDLEQVAQDLLEQLDYVQPDAFEPDNSIDEASASRLGVSQDRTLHTTSTDELDEDFIRFETVMGGEYDIQLTIQPQETTDAIIQVLDSSGTLLEEFDGGGSGNGDAGTFVAPADGFYYVRVSAYNRLTIGPYQFLIDGPAAD